MVPAVGVATETACIRLVGSIDSNLMSNSLACMSGRDTPET